MFRNRFVFILTFVVLTADIFAYNVIFPDRSGLLLPGETYDTESQSEVMYFFKPYKINGNSESIYSLGYNQRTDGGIFEFGIEQRFYSQSNLDEPGPRISVKMNINDVMYYNKYIVGLLFDTENDNYSSVYVMSGNIGVGFNFGGKKGGNALFGGYDFSDDEPDRFFILLRYEFNMNDSSSLGFEFNGDDISLFGKFTLDSNFNLMLGYISENDYDDKYNLLDDDQVVFGVYSEF